LVQPFSFWCKFIPPFTSWLTLLSLIVLATYRMVLIFDSSLLHHTETETIILTWIEVERHVYMYMHNMYVLWGYNNLSCISLYAQSVGSEHLYVATYVCSGNVQMFSSCKFFVWFESATYPNKCVLPCVLCTLRNLGEKLTCDFIIVAS